jgi:hypothetical protein
MRASTHAHTCTHMYTHIYTHAHARTHTHTHTICPTTQTVSTYFVQWQGCPHPPPDPHYLFHREEVLRFPATPAQQTQDTYMTEQTERKADGCLCPPQVLTGGEEVKISTLHIFSFYIQCKDVTLRTIWYVGKQWVQITQHGQQIHTHWPQTHYLTYATCFGLHGHLQGYQSILQEYDTF